MKKFAVVLLLLAFCSCASPRLAPGDKYEGEVRQFMDGETGGPMVVYQSDVGGAEGIVSSERGVWGGHQPMVASTEKAVYTAFFSKNGDFNALNFFALENGAWRRIEIEDTAELNRFDSSSSVITLAAGEKVYIVSNDRYNKVCVWEYDERAGTVSGCITSRQGGDGYLSAALDKERGKIYALYSGGGKPGWLQLHELALAEGKFARSVSILTDYRYCYTYILPNADGYMIVGGRDAIYTAIGYTPGIQEGSYAFDALGAWQVYDAQNKSFGERIDIALEPFNPDYIPSIHNNYLGDALCASDGKTYVAYYIQGESTEKRGETHMAVLENGEVTYRTKLFDSGMGTRFFETPDGSLWLLRMCAAEGEKTLLTVYKADGERKSFSEVGGFTLDGGGITYANHRVFAPRGGASPSYEADIVYPTADGYHWRYLRLVLDSGAAGP